MKKIKNKTEAARVRRKKHIRKVVFGTAERPRLVVYRSTNQIYAQLVDDHAGAVIGGISSLNPELKNKTAELKGKIAVGKLVGQAVAELAKEKGISAVVFDRNGFLYHGRVKAVADGARDGGLQF
ncbi:50S ribosomal protein L18 [bacterium]|nr:50S ribosomal protein L18 [bacterium]